MTNNVRSAALAVALVAASLVAAFAVLNGVTRTAELVADASATTVTGTYDVGAAGTVTVYADRSAVFTPEPVPSTYYLLADDDSIDAVAQCLTDLGWSGIAGDGRSAIYAPTVVIRDCGGEFISRHMAI